MFFKYLCLLFVIGLQTAVSADTLVVKSGRLKLEIPQGWEEMSAAECLGAGSDAGIKCSGVANAMIAILCEKNPDGQNITEEDHDGFLKYYVRDLVNVGNNPLIKNAIVQEPLTKPVIMTSTLGRVCIRLNFKNGVSRDQLIYSHIRGMYHYTFIISAKQDRFHTIDSTFQEIFKSAVFDRGNFSFPKLKTARKDSLSLDERAKLFLNGKE